jgi:cytochrome o ubiquinol oxidase subunit II
MRELRRLCAHVFPRMQQTTDSLMHPHGGSRLSLCHRAVVSAAVAALTTSCSEGVLDPRGPVGKAERIILYDATAIMLAVVIPVIFLTLAFAWWFRSKNSRARYRPDWEYSGRIEMIIWSIPALVILFLGGIAYTGSHDLDPPAQLRSSTAPLEIEVIALDWRWLFIYPKQGIASLNRLVVPAGVPLRFRLTSTTVMNSFFVPQLGSQIYAMPNMVTKLNLQADEPGTFEGLSAQFSGDGFSDMHFALLAMESQAFDAWVADAKTQDGVLDADSFKRLTAPAKAQGDQIYAHVSEHLFDTILSGRSMPDSRQQGH